MKICPFYGLAILLPRSQVIKEVPQNRGGLRRTDRSDPATRTTRQRRDEHQRQRQKALDLVHHGGHLQRLSHRRLALAGSVGKAGGAGVLRLFELRLFFGQLLVRLELLDQGPVLLGSLDT